MSCLNEVLQLGRRFQSQTVRGKKAIRRYYYKSTRNLSESNLVWGRT